MRNTYAYSHGATHACSASFQTTGNFHVGARRLIKRTVWHSTADRQKYITTYMA